MHKLASAKIFFCLAVLLFVAKPFLGFSMFSRQHPPAVENILVKAFTKRKPEDPENSVSKTEAIQKKLAEQARYFVLRFSFLLGIISPLVFASGANITPRFLRGLQLSLPPQRDTWLLNGKLII
ncbi:MAG TPA: hypothetical protein DCO83_04230 [Mucilaginibacter sp.]|jgi:hypothetical protein|nr:hypothetical protein [Mucilaginibacter sp.]